MTFPISNCRFHLLRSFALTSSIVQAELQSAIEWWSNNRREYNGMETEGSHKSEWARHTWECVAPIHIRGHCPHPSNHLRRRIHQPSLLPHNIHRNACAVQ